jgi:Uma2 family endonuclease
MVAARVLEVPPLVSGEADQRVALSDVSWWQYEALLAIRGDRPGPRVTYLNGVLELMSPSRSHEALKKLIARLLEAYAEIAGLELEGYGSMTMRSAPRARGIEPDECYAVGGAKESPDLAIEVIWTSGGLDKLEVYKGLRVREVWLWQDQVLSVHVLRGDEYATAERSAVLPDLDLRLLASFLDVETQTRALREYRAALRATLGP